MNWRGILTVTAATLGMLAGARGEQRAAVSAAVSGRPALSVLEGEVDGGEQEPKEHTLWSTSLARASGR